MADDSASKPAQPLPALPASTEQPTASAKDVPSAPGTTDRGELIAQAHAFLVSPQIQYQDVAAKRVFLKDKGLNDIEIDGLLREHVCGHFPTQSNDHELS
jgi:Pex14 N-terminal domain